MGLNIGLAPNVVITALDEVFMTEFSQEEQPGFANALDGQVFMQETTDRNAVIVEQFMGSGYWDQRAEQADLAQGTARVGNQQTFSVLNFAKQVDISKNLFDDDQHGTVGKMIKNFARNARMTRDRHAFEQYNLGFTTVTSNDGVALFSNSHTTLNGGTVDNLVSGALSDTTLEAAINLLLQQNTQDDVLGGHTPGVLLVPTTLFKEATVFTETELRPTTANNDLNYVSKKYPGLEVRTTAFLGNTQGITGSDTAWYVLSKDHSMNRWQRQGVDTRMINWENQRNNNYIYKGEYREVVGPISFEGMVGSTGL